jgi:hypothetical protein
MPISNKLRISEIQGMMGKPNQSMIVLGGDSTAAGLPTAMPGKTHEPGGAGEGSRTLVISLGS